MQEAEEKREKEGEIFWRKREEIETEIDRSGKVNGEVTERPRW